MANSEPPPREVVETDEYTAQYEDIIRRHSLDIIGPVLTGVVEGIAKNPRAMERLTGNIWMEKKQIPRLDHTEVHHLLLDRGR